MSARVGNMVLGIWLVLSAFLWPHSTPRLINGVLVGSLVVALAILAAQGGAWARHLNTAVAVWLFLLLSLMPTIRARRLRTPGP